jgi:hypothetical protein
MGDAAGLRERFAATEKRKPILFSNENSGKLAAICDPLEGDAF